MQRFPLMLLGIVLVLFLTCASSASAQVAQSPAGPLLAALASGGQMVPPPPVPDAAPAPAYSPPPGYGAAPVYYQEPINVGPPAYAPPGVPAGPPIYAPPPGAYIVPSPSCDNGPLAALPADNPHYGYFDSEIFFATRNNTSHNQPLVVDSLTGQTYLSTRDLDFNFESGLLTTIGYMFSQGWGLEGTYWGQFGFGTGYLIQGANNLSLPGALGTTTFDYNGVSQITAIYNSDVNNFELNFVIPFDNIQFLTGFRYFELEELLDINGNPGFESSDYLIRTHNDLWGWQLGARGQWYWGRVEFSLALKAGIYGDSAYEHQMVGDFGNSVVLRDASASRTTSAFIGELGAYVKAPLTPWLALRGGYTAVWITDLALAPNQLDFTNTASSGRTLNTHSSMLLDGFNIGLEARW